MFDNHAAPTVRNSSIGTAARDFLAAASHQGKPVATNILILDANKLAFSPKELAAATSFGKTAIFEAIREGKLIARKAGRRTFIEADAARAWLRTFPTTAEIIAA